MQNENEVIQLEAASEPGTNTPQATPTPPAPAEDSEIDVSAIVRPEQFYTGQVAGLALPVATNGKAGPESRYRWYLRWADGHRESRALADYLDLTNAARLWVRPSPGIPSMHMPPRWSPKARRKWMQGAKAPRPSKVFWRLRRRIGQFIDLAPDREEGTLNTLALWVIYTYVYQGWNAVPYLFLTGPKGSGKTTLLSVLARLVFRPFMTSSPSVASIFRTLHNQGGTFLLDEAEQLKVNTPEVGQMNSLFMSGYKKGMPVTRMEAVGDGYRTVEFDVYCPKALACITGLPDTLLSRCITIMMIRADHDSSKPKRRIDRRPQAWQQLRDDLHAMALEYGQQWPSLAERADICPGISGRSFELWQPLLALAAMIEEDGLPGLLATMQKHAKGIVNESRDDQVSEADEVLLDILTVYVLANEAPTAKEILTVAQDRDMATFGRGWTPRMVSFRLKQYSIDSPTKSNGQRRYRHVTVAMLRKIEQRYGIDLSLPPEDTTPEATSLTATCDPATTPELDPTKDERLDEYPSSGDSQADSQQQDEVPEVEEVVYA